MAPSASQESPTSQIRKPPYLQRNWLTTMGSAVHQMDHEENENRPSKRRRVSKNSLDLGIGLEALDAAALTTSPEKAVRIHLLRVVHKVSTRVRAGIAGLVPLPNSEGLEARARCRISISGGGLRGADHHLLVDSQICTIKAFKNPHGPSPMLRIHLPQPFHIPQDKILVPGDDDDVFALAKRYTANIQLESAGDSNWPPEFLSPANNAGWLNNQGGTPRRQWILHATVDDLFNCGRKAIPLDLAKRPDVLLSTNYVLDVDVRWSTALPANKIKPVDKDVRASITCYAEDDVMDVDHTTETNGVNGHAHGVNGANGHHANGDVELANGELLDEMDEQAEGDLTPGRRRRARPQINYNLKLLSDKAQKKERRRREKQAPQNGTAEVVEDSGVTYLFPDKLHLDGCCCIFCGTDLRSFELLRAHCKLNHDDFDFQFAANSKTVTVTAHLQRPVTPPLSPKELHLGPPVDGPLDLPAYLEGDDTWVRARQGSQDDREVRPAQTAAQKKPAAADPNKIPSLVPRGKPKKIIVPRTKTTLYHPFSKAPLEPGTVMDRWQVDEDWLIRKHSDTLADYMDIEPYELEFMQEWDRYFLPLHLSSEMYLPAHYLVFVRDKADWIVAKQHRSIEFSKSMAVLHARAVIKEEHITKALAILDEARARRKAKEDAGELEAEEEPAQQATLQKSEGAGCARCGGFVLPGPNWLSCQGAVSAFLGLCLKIGC
ncbi:hypothetical protein GE09DRAFT_298574 [Coniochaeta sp. 2T2.1]|nr:hypothetical protein GE09DRAFT_298574 [Coniochaeta sp. 2T2.1]